MTPRKPVRRGHWPCWNYENFSYKISLTKLQNCETIKKCHAKFQRGHWPCDFHWVIDNAEIHMTPLKFQIVVLGPQHFLEFFAKLFHREISLYHFLTLTKKKLGNSRIHFDNFRSDYLSEHKAICKTRWGWNRGSKILCSCPFKHINFHQVLLLSKLVQNVILIWTCCILFMRT
jgi:hypothetical protein